MGMVPEIDVERVKRWAAVQIPVSMQDQVRVEIDVDRLHITVVESREPWPDGAEWIRQPYARLRYTKTRDEWTLYCYRGSGKIERFPFARPTRHIEELLDIIDEDVTGIFKG